MGESVEEPSPSIKDYFNELFSYALLLGMPSSEFWNGDTDWLNSYIEAGKMKQRRDNENNWLNGLYVQMAVASCLSKDAKYPKRPIPITQEEIDERNNRSLLKLREELIAEAKKGN